MRSVRAEYDVGDARWTQTFRSRELSDGQLAGHLAAGLTVDRALTDDGTWLLARSLGRPAFSADPRLP